MTDLIQYKKNYLSLVGYFAGKAEAQSKTKKLVLRRYYKI